MYKASQESARRGTTNIKKEGQRCPVCMALLSEQTSICSYCGQCLPVINDTFCLTTGFVLEHEEKRYLVGKCIDIGESSLSYIGWDLQKEQKVRLKEYYLHGIFKREGSLVIYPFDKKKYQEYGEKAFIKEAQNLERISYIKNVSHLVDFFKTNGTVYIVTDFTEGNSLEKWIMEKGPVSFSESVSILAPLILAVEEIHESGLIHRDINPSNIILTKTLMPVLEGFGASRFFSDISLSDSASVCGFMEESHYYTVMTKDGYSPPEQYVEDSVQGPWGDVYGICATLYYMITGRDPDYAVQRLGQDSLPKPSDLGAEINFEEEEVLVRGLAPFMGERWTSIKELQDALKDVSLKKRNESSHLSEKTLFRCALFSFFIILTVLATVFFWKRRWEGKAEPLIAFNYNDHSYGLYSLKDARIDSHEEMKLFCENIGGYPASVSDLKENRIIYNQLLAAGYNSAFFGYVDANQSGSFTWLHKEKGDFAFWSARALDNFPDNIGDALVARFHPDLQNGQWDYGTLTDSSAFFLCEWDHEKTGVESVSLTGLWDENSFICGQHRFSLLSLRPYSFSLQGQRGLDDDYICYRALCEYCYVRGAYPAVIEDNDMNDYLYSKVFENNWTTAGFGFSCWADGKTWSWTDGQSTFLNWGQEQPDRKSDPMQTKYFARFIPYGGGSWESVSFSESTEIFIIEWDN